MYNWSVDETKLKKDPEKFTVWKLEQLINFGLNGEKIKREELLRYFSQLTIDPPRRKYLTFLLYGK